MTPSKAISSERGGTMPPHRRFPRTASAVAAMALLLASCSHPWVGVTAGDVYRGGAAPGNSNILRPGTIQIFTSSGVLKTSGRVREGNLLHASLPPGNYRVEARSGDAQCA